VTGNGVPDDDMPTTGKPPRQDRSAVTDAGLDALLAGTVGDTPELRPVADMLAALTAEATAGELAGEARALAEFRRRAAAPATGQSARPRAAGLNSRLGAKFGAVAAGAAIVFGGAATAAFANMLPAPIQRLAHDTIGAPAPARHEAPARPTAPGAPAAHGQPPAHGSSRAGAHPGPRTTAPHPAQGNPQGQGNQGNPQGQGKHGQPHGGGQHGNGNGQGNGNGNGHKNGQHASPHAPGQHGSPHATGQHGSPHATPRRAAHPASLALADVVMSP
jgi:hypothetical protein